ncbi:MAG: hypothetical protein OXF78_11720 [Rhodospirillales bacterium]|nr:hypothetical protein [Rhodospirillales bacterium]
MENLTIHGEDIHVACPRALIQRRGAGSTAGLRAVADHLEGHGDREGVVGQVETWSGSANRPSIEALFSVLWQARWPVVRLFPDAARPVRDR